MSGVTNIKIKPEDDGIRLNRWFLREYPALSMGRLQKLLRTKQIKVDGKRAETSTRLAAGQEIRIPPLDNEKATPDNTVLNKSDIEYITSMVIFKDKNIIVLNKPSGLAVQGGTNTTRHVDGLLEALKFENTEKPKLVHRIDKDTSGILVLARNRQTADVLTKAFREHTLNKTYLALVRGCPEKFSGEIRLPLEKVGEKMQIVNGGKKAVTQYEVLDNAGKKYALVQASPLTGRTHQIRAHLEGLGTPILGDGKYFGTERCRLEGVADKLYLHAYQIDLSAVYGKKMIIKAEPPKHFAEACQFFGLDWKK
ncbi:MAG: RluA family pseudouridine synthase [Alphaproteobacteria bacterium]|nr:RluA family pseudouridine synthase [Alphaproteobacteria bacterium]